MEFTTKKYIELLNTLQSQGFCFLPYFEHGNPLAVKTIILRQDVDLLPENSITFAKIQSEFGIRSTFYFRSAPESFDEKIISKIHNLGHEIGYHYEDFAVARQKTKDKRQKLKSDLHDLHDLQDLQDNRSPEKELTGIAIQSFEMNLEKLRKLVPVNTICMHGSPMSRRDSRLLWKYYDYRVFGIVAEPYFDIDFSEMLYLTDTGRKWDGEAVSVRDKGIVSREQGVVSREQGVVSREQGIVSSEKGKDWNGDYYANWKVKPVRGSLMNMTPEGIEFQRRHVYRSTDDIIKAIEEGNFPERAMITFHPQRWTDKPVPWMKELIWQNAKNVVKYFIIKGVVNRE